MQRPSIDGDSRHPPSLRSRHLHHRFRGSSDIDSSIVITEFEGDEEERREFTEEEIMRRNTEFIERLVPIHHLEFHFVVFITLLPNRYISNQYFEILTRMRLKEKERRERESFVN